MGKCCIATQIRSEKFVNTVHKCIFKDQKAPMVSLPEAFMNYVLSWGSNFSLYFYHKAFIPVTKILLECTA